MKKKILVILAVIINILLFTGCGQSANTYTYNVKNINHCKNIYITQTKYYDDRVEISFKADYSLESYKFFTENGSVSSQETKSNTLIMYSDNPEEINSVEVNSSWLQVKFRNLDSDEYATIWSYWADDLGWTEFEGDKEKYYTIEEQEYQAKIAYEIEENRKKAAQVSNDILEIIEGKWVSEDGYYFDITKKDFGSALLFYDADRDGFTECAGIRFSWISEDENTINMFESPDGWGAYYSFDIELSEDGKSFEYDSKTYYLADEDVWSNVDIRYIHAVNTLFNHAEEWKKTDLQDASEIEEKETDEQDSEAKEEETDEEKVSPICRYAVTDLDMNGFPEVIVSGCDEDGMCFLDILQTTADGNIGKIKTNFNTDSVPVIPALYNSEELFCAYSSNKYQDVYRYLVEGKIDYGADTYFIQNYWMSVQINSLVLEKLCSQELIEDEEGRKASFYNEKSEELSSVEYFNYMGGARSESDKKVNLSWFDEITIENMAESFGVFLESINRETEE